MSTELDSPTIVSATDEWKLLLEEILPPQGAWTHGVPEYWIVNPQTETVSVLTLRGQEYVEAGCHGRGEQAKSILLSGLAVDVAALFDAE